VQNSRQYSDKLKQWIIGNSDGKPVCLGLSRSTGRDVAVDKQKERMGIGVRIRDDIGEVLATLSPPKDHIIAFDVTKAMAALQTVTFSR
jgi:hypothetical protein